MKNQTIDPMLRESLEIADVKIEDLKMTLVLNHVVPEIWKIAYFKNLPSLSSEFIPATATFIGNIVEMVVPLGSEGVVAHQFQNCMDAATQSYSMYVLNIAKEELAKIEVTQVTEHRSKTILEDLKRKSPLGPRLLGSVHQEGE